MTAPIKGLCSKAPKDLLDDLADVLRERRSIEVSFEASGGVDVVRDVRAGADADLVVLGQRQLEDLDADGSLVAGTSRPLFVSDVVAAVPADAAPMALSSEEALRTALTSARRIAHSTGPSGTALLDLLQSWGLLDSVRPRLVRAEPGRPVASLLEAGEADLGFQQLSELSRHPSVRVVGPLPGTAAIRSTFGGAVLTRSTDVESARAVLDFFGSPEVQQAVSAGGMTLA